MLIVSLNLEIMINQNLGKVDRVLRFALAFWLLGPFAPKFDINWVDAVIVIVGLIALVESFLGWCGLHRFLGLDNKN